MQSEKIKVFISSTSMDLHPERDSAMEQLKRMEIPFAAMEYFGSRNNPPDEVSIKELGDCQIYIGIIGFRYGSLMQNSPKSYTEHEYDYASGKRLHRLIYLKSEPSSQDDFDCDQDRRDKLNDFRARFLEGKECTISFFEDARDLSSRIASDLYKYMTEKISKEISDKLVEKTELFQMPRVIVKRALGDLLYTTRILSDIHSSVRRNKAQSKAWDFLRNYRFRFDGQFTVVDSNGDVIFHDFMRAMEDQGGRALLVPEFRKILKYQVIGNSEGIIKWIDYLSADYILIDEANYLGYPSEKWIRFNVAPFLYFLAWDWYIIVEAHNEIHGLEESEVQSFNKTFREAGWSYIEPKYPLLKQIEE